MNGLLHRLADRMFIKQPRVREALTAAIYGRGDCDIDLMGLRLRINRLRENGYFRASRKSKASSFLAHEIHVANILAMLANRADVFVDAGANVGIFSSLMSFYRRLVPEFRIIAFEPHPDTYMRLSENGRRHGFESHQLALSDEDCVKTFIDGAVSHVFTAEAQANAYNISNRQFQVNCRRLDGLMSPHGAIFLKIDTEGQEFEVLKGAEHLFATRRVAGVYLDGHDADRVPKFLASYGFELLDVATLAQNDGSAYGLLALNPAPRSLP